MVVDVACEFPPNSLDIGIIGVCMNLQFFGAFLVQFAELVENLIN